MTKTTLRAGVTLALALAGGILFAQNSTSQAAVAVDMGAVITSVDRETLGAMLRAEGFAPSLVKEKSITLKLQGYSCFISVNKTDLQIYAWFSGPADKDKVNQFNSDYRFATAYWDEEGDVCIQADLDLEGGSTMGAVKEWVQVFSSLLQDWSDL